MSPPSVIFIDADQLPLTARFMYPLCLPGYVYALTLHLPTLMRPHSGFAPSRLAYYCRSRCYYVLP